MTFLVLNIVGRTLSYIRVQAFGLKKEEMLHRNAHSLCLDNTLHICHEVTGSVAYDPSLLLLMCLGYFRLRLVR